MAEYIPFCDSEFADLYYDYLDPAIYIVGLILFTPMIFMFIRSQIQGTLQIPMISFCTTQFYFTVQLIKWILDLIWLQYVCGDDLQTTALISGISGSMYSIQTSILIGLLFYRLYRTFLGVPSLQLSKFTIITFTVCYTITTVLSLVAIISFLLSTVNILFYAMATILNILLIIVLFVMYIYKMRSVYKTGSTKDENLINIISKISLLAIISISITILAFLSLPLHSIFHSPHYDYVVVFITVADVYTNALCIFLMFKRFDNYYYGICSLCHHKCIRKCVENKNTKHMENSVNSVV